jgi:hypothetical protein
VVVLYQLPVADKKAVKNSAKSYWGIVIGTAILVFFIRAVSGEDLLLRDHIVSLMASTIIGLILASLYFKFSFPVGIEK